MEAVEVDSLLGKVVDGEGGATEAAATALTTEALDGVSTVRAVVTVSYPPLASGWGGEPVLSAVGIGTETGMHHKDLLGS